MNFSKKNIEHKKTTIKFVSKTIVMMSTVLFLCVTELGMAQNVSSISQNNSNSYSYSINDSDDQNGNVSISSNSSSDSYSFRAKYSGAKDSELKDLITKEMGSNNLTTDNGKSRWIANSGEEEVYEIELRKGRLTMEVDKNIASPSLVKKIESLGKMAKTIITGKTEANSEASRMQREADRLKRQADRMQREADRMKREEERIKRDAERIKSEHTTRYQEDAKRFKEEAKRLASEADEMEIRARHLGGVSNTVRTLLHQERTFYNGRSQDESSNWVWPKVQESLIAMLISDGYISNERTVNFAMDNSGNYINGEKMSEPKRSRYTKLFESNGIGKNLDITFNKDGDHIVIIESVDIEGLAQELIKKGIISSINDKTSFEINGYSVVKDGKTLSKGDVANYNKLLLKYGAIPAPGKILEFMGKGAYKIGYSIGSKTHVGTWVFAE
jgi:hypothetical protein